MRDSHPAETGPLADCPALYLKASKASFQYEPKTR